MPVRSQLFEEANTGLDFFSKQLFRNTQPCCCFDQNLPAKAWISQPCGQAFGQCFSSAHRSPGNGDDRHGNTSLQWSYPPCSSHLPAKNNAYVSKPSTKVVMTTKALSRLTAKRM